MRGPFLLAVCPVAIAGYAMLIATKTSAIQYAGSVVVGVGISPIMPILLSWVGGNFAGEAKKAVVIGIMAGFGNLGGQVLQS